MTSTKQTTQAAPQKPTSKNGSQAGECHHAADELRDMGARIADSTKGLREQLAKQTQRNPLASVGVAFAAGILLARALRR
ncbi:MAG: hypothetical protein WBV39_06455 [Rudaea sp.]